MASLKEKMKMSEERGEGLNIIRDSNLETEAQRSIDAALKDSGATLMHRW